jgi:GTP-binding protein
MAISAAHGLGTGDLLDRITATLGPVRRATGRAPRLAVIGRPNVGKSSLVNAFVGSNGDRLRQAGTTRRLDRH